MSGQRSSPSDSTARLALLSLRIDANEVTSTIRAMLNTLSKSEAAVFAMRFGLTDGQPKTLDEIGKVYGVTRQRVRQIEARCIKKLRLQAENSPLAVNDNGQVVGFVDIRRTDPRSLDGDLVLCPHCLERKFLPSGRGSSGGRPRKYCTNACRQAAYRARRAG